ncbi:MAG: exonuclease domain-containing protein [Gammaproteobacteria bacterium]|nr:exonuclease domain-containing protein [Gammaproteobacteria bacterium]
MLVTHFPALYRQYLLTRIKTGPLRQYLNAPLPAPSQTVHDTEFVSLDFETTGLNPETDEILSIGYTVIKNSHILLRKNGYHLIKPEYDIHQSSVAIHGITDTDAQQGRPLSEVFEILLPELAGKVLLAHNAIIEQTFLNRLCKQVYGYALPLRIIDTLKVEQRRLLHHQQHIATGQLRLFNLRSQYHLPRYKAHNALEDAIATAELFLAMAHNRCNQLEKCKIKEFL